MYVLFMTPRIMNAVSVKRANAWIKKKRLQVVVFLKLDSYFINTFTERKLTSELFPSSYGNSQSIKTEARTISYGRVREVRATSDWQLAHGTLLNHPGAPLC